METLFESNKSKSHPVQLLGISGFFSFFITGWQALQLILDRATASRRITPTNQRSISQQGRKSVASYMDRPRVQLTMHTAVKSIKELRLETGLQGHSICNAKLLMAATCIKRLPVMIQQAQEADSFEGQQL